MGITLRADGASTSKDVLRSSPRSLEELEQLLNDGETKDVPKIIGICGLHGLPAIAMSIYKNFGPLFDGNCFLKHARKPRKSTDVNNKENQVISDLVPTDKSTGKEALLVRGKKALIILDDARHPKELDMLKELQLGPDSLIVILAKERKLLRDMHVDYTIEAGVDGLKFSIETITKATAAATVDELPVEDRNMKDGSSQSSLMGCLEIDSQEDRLVHSTPSDQFTDDSSSAEDVLVHGNKRTNTIGSPSHRITIAVADNVLPTETLLEQRRSRIRRCINVLVEGWALLILASIIEVASLVFAQKELDLLSMVMAYLALAVCLTDMALALQWCCSRRPRRTFGNVLDYFGLISATWQCIHSTMGYIYFLRGSKNPIKIGLNSIILLLCMLVAKFVECCA